MFNFRKKKLDQVFLYQSVFNSDDGKKVLFDMMKVHHVFGSTFSKDPYETALKEGERNTVLRILSILQIDPEKLLEDINKGIEQDNQYID
jgi:hypothetical protein